MMDTPASGEKSVDILALLSEVLKSRSLTLEVPESLDSNPEFMELRETLIDVREFLLALSVGDLSRSMPRKGYLAGALKALHSSLRHLTWQTGMIASGDFTQRVDFMGEFSESFNAMVRKLEETMQQLEKASRTDPLTGINNRGYFMQLLIAEVERSCRYGRAFSVLMVDLDHFKKINDTFGHAAGDVALQSFAAVLQCCGLRNIDFWGRLGGEEFAVVLPEITLDHALLPAERIRCTLAETPVSHADTSFIVTASIGVSQFVPGDTVESLLSRADQAMYRAKEKGRNRVCHA
jgi:diguanylate cyclase (GGDEF)-like protein